MEIAPVQPARALVSRAAPPRKRGKPRLCNKVQARELAKRLDIMPWEDLRDRVDQSTSGQLDTARLDLLTDWVAEEQAKLAKSTSVPIGIGAEQPDANFIGACNKFTAAHETLWKVGGDNAHLHFEAAAKVAEPFCKAKDRAGEALAKLRPSGLAEHAARAKAALHVATAHVGKCDPIELCLAEYLPDGLLFAILRDLAGDCVA